MSTPEFDVNALLEAAQSMQAQLYEAQAAAAETEVVGQAGGGVVKVAVTGGMDFRSVTIDPKAVDPDDVTMLEDLVLAALHDAVSKANEVNQNALGGLAGLGGLGGLGGGIPGLGDGGGLGGLLGPG